MKVFFLKLKDNITEKEKNLIYNSFLTFLDFPHSFFQESFFLKSNVNLFISNKEKFFDCFIIYLLKVFNFPNIEFFLMCNNAKFHLIFLYLEI